MEIKEESGLTFEFSEGTKVIKFDETRYYTKSFNTFPRSKGVDFIAVAQDFISFIEVKNCLAMREIADGGFFPIIRKGRQAKNDYG